MQGQEPNHFFKCSNIKCKVGVWIHDVTGWGNMYTATWATCHVFTHGHVTYKRMTTSNLRRQKHNYTTASPVRHTSVCLPLWSPSWPLLQCTLRRGHVSAGISIRRIVSDYSPTRYLGKEFLTTSFTKALSSPGPQRAWERGWVSEWSTYLVTSH